MNGWKYALCWVLTFVFTSAIDALWHLALFKKVYTLDFKPLARMAGDRISFNGPAGILSQALVVTGIVILVLYSTAGRGTSAGALLVGALAGVLAISVYGITNYALMKDWSLRLTVLEVVWGPILGGMSGLFVYGVRGLLSR
ncbi:MAG: DUF2177 family protein [Candidatus Aminicenantales bacterium]